MDVCTKFLWYCINVSMSVKNYTSAHFFRNYLLTQDNDDPAPKIQYLQQRLFFDKWSCGCLQVNIKSEFLSNCPELFYRCSDWLDVRARSHIAAITRFIPFLVNYNSQNMNVTNLTYNQLTDYMYICRWRDSGSGSHKSINERKQQNNFGLMTPLQFGLKKQTLHPSKWLISAVVTASHLCVILDQGITLLLITEQTHPCCWQCPLFSVHFPFGCEGWYLWRCCLKCPLDSFLLQKWTWGTSLQMWREPMQDTAANFSFKSVFLCLINYILKEATKYRLISYLVNNCTQGFKFFFAFSIESYSTARIHARESHFPGIFTVKGLQTVMRKKNAHVPGKKKLEKLCKQLEII